MLSWNCVYIIYDDTGYTTIFTCDKGFGYKNLQILRYAVHNTISILLTLVADKQKFAKQQQNTTKVKVHVCAQCVESFFGQDV